MVVVWGVWEGLGWRLGWRLGRWCGLCDGVGRCWSALAVCGLERMGGQCGGQRSAGAEDGAVCGQQRRTAVSEAMSTL